MCVHAISRNNVIIVFGGVQRQLPLYILEGTKRLRTKAEAGTWSWAPILLFSLVAHLQSWLGKLKQQVPTFYYHLLGIFGGLWSGSGEKEGHTSFLEPAWVGEAPVYSMLNANIQILKLMVQTLSSSWNLHRFCSGQPAVEVSRTDYLVSNSKVSFITQVTLDLYWCNIEKNLAQVSCKYAEKRCISVQTHSLCILHGEMSHFLCLVLHKLW